MSNVCAMYTARYIISVTIHRPALMTFQFKAPTTRNICAELTNAQASNKQNLQEEERPCSPHYSETRTVNFPVEGSDKPNE